MVGLVATNSNTPGESGVVGVISDDGVIGQGNGA